MGNDGKKTLTVFTPAYNRAHTLGRTYHSLCRQGCKDFIWLVVDDGSTDGTAELDVDKRQSRVSARKIQTQRVVFPSKA